LKFNININGEEKIKLTFYIWLKF